MRKIAAALASAALLSTACAGAVPSTGMVNINAPAAASVSGRLLYVRGGAIEELSASGNRDLAKANPAVWRLYGTRLVTRRQAHRLRSSPEGLQ